MSQDNIDLPLPPPPPPGKRNFKVIALALVCIILAGSLVGVIVLYKPTSSTSSSNTSSLQAQITQQNNTIGSLNQQIASLQNQLAESEASQSTSGDTAALQSQITELQQELAQANSTVLSDQTTIMSDQNTLTDDQSILSMSATEPLADSISVNQNNYTIVSVFGSNSANNVLPDPGFITVQATSTSNTTYVETIYSAYGVNFDQNVTIGTSGTAVFPVLPSTINVLLGNTDPNGNNSTVTINYYY